MLFTQETSVGDLKSLVSNPKYSIVRDRMRAVILRRQGKSFRAIAQTLDRSLDFVKSWNDRFKSHGAPGLETKKVTNSQSSILTTEQKELLKSRVLAGPTESDKVSVFTQPVLREIVKSEFGVDCSISTISSALRSMGLRKVKPRPVHEKNNPCEMTRWINESLPFFLRQVIAEHPGKVVSVWFQDESRFGQKNRVVNVWSEGGKRPTVIQQGGFKSGYLFGAVNPLSGDHVGLVSNTCDSDWMQHHLNEISRHACPTDHFVLVIDGAGWHHSASLVIPSNISLFFLPPYSPELNPVERLWLWIKSHYLSNCIYESTATILAKGESAWKALTHDIVKSVCDATKVLPSWYVEYYNEARLNL